MRLVFTYALKLIFIFKHTLALEIRKAYVGFVFGRPEPPFGRFDSDTGRSEQLFERLEPASGRPEPASGRP